MTSRPARAFVALVVVLLAGSAFSGCLASLNPVTSQEWPLALIQADTLKDEGLSGKGVKVAIIDTGIDLAHPEFRGLTVRWADLVNDKPTAYDDNGHGSHIAGILVAQGDWTTVLSGFYMKGVSPGVSLIVIKAIAANGTGDEENVARGIDTAVANGADVIVLSLGGGTVPIFGTKTEQSVKDAIARGIYVVAAAGNLKEGESSCKVTSPATVDGVIAVGAVDRNRVAANFSCEGDNTSGSGLLGVQSRSDPNKKPEVVAPGVEILSAWKDERYVVASGTSQAAPFVAGLIALLLEKHPELKHVSPDTVARVKQALMTTSAKIGPLAGGSPSAHDDKYGYGLVQGVALVNAFG
ncbi:MAG: S8 family peptidase [Thermoplasmatota archaeon]